MGMDQRLSELALKDPSVTNLNQAVEWIVQNENKLPNSDQPQVSVSQTTNSNQTNPNTAPTTSPITAPITTSPSTSENPQTTTSKVESRINKKMEEDKLSWQKREAEKEYLRLKKEKQRKLEEAAKVKARIEEDRKARGELNTMKSKEEQELEWKQKEIEREKLLIQQKKAAERAEKERIKHLLEEDKQRRLQLEANKSSTTSPKPPSHPSTTSTKPPSSPPISQAGTYTLQIRLPDGKALRQKFNSDYKLQFVYDFTASHLDSDVSFSFIIPVPKREFAAEDMQKTLQELGLNGATLTVLLSLKRGVVKQAQVNENTNVDVDSMSYEQIVDLGNRIGPHKTVPEETLAEKINKLPKYKWQKKPETEETPLCLICQCDFEEAEEIKTLPCTHEFHVQCVDPWLRDNGICPLCKNKVF
eukprot:TRINITY_DN10599_c0_g1_i1.p1 TRINITY_DN10599_c0_g1~~TRINITY_DN10599_c0_g1_i1.p1  ORF type:complete len:456 (-),score=153.88 TRINITY_DN10599_c0_g1_i1:44-1294(-)